MDEGYQNVAKRNRKIQIISRLKKFRCYCDFTSRLHVWFDSLWQGMKTGQKSQLTFNPFIEPNSWSKAIGAWSAWLPELYTSWSLITFSSQGYASFGLFMVPRPPMIHSKFGYLYKKLNQQAWIAFIYLNLGAVSNNMRDEIQTTFINIIVYLRLYFVFSFLIKPILRLESFYGQTVLRKYTEGDWLMN